MHRLLSRGGQLAQESNAALRAEIAKLKSGDEGPRQRLGEEAPYENHELEVAKLKKEIERLRKERDQGKAVIASLEFERQRSVSTTQEEIILKRQDDHEHDKRQRSRYESETTPGPRQPEVS
jgi:cell division protein FtsB